MFGSQASDLIKDGTGGTYAYDVATQALTRVGAGEPLGVEAGRVLSRDGEQLRWNDQVVGRGSDAQLSADGAVVVYEREGTVHRRDMAAGGAERSVGEGTHARVSGDGRTVAYEAGGDIVIGERTIADASLRGLSDDGRFVLYADEHGDLRRRDLIAQRTSHVASGATAPFAHATLSADGRRAVFSTASADVIDNFVDGNDTGADVFSWFDTPPVPVSEAKITAR